MRRTLRKLFTEHEGKVSDQWSLYLKEWDRLFAPYRDGVIRLLEIGVQNGGSLEVWGKYFERAERIVGCDIDPRCKQLRYDDDRIVVIVGDANSDDCQSEILQRAPTLDVIIDDGSHRSSDIVRSFARYFPHLNDNGIYVLEDTHCSYWEEFEGGMHSPLSSVAFFKRLADVVNYEHWRNNKPRAELISKFAMEFGIEFNDLELARIHSIEFVNSLCIVKKLPPEQNVLAMRLIVGSDELVTSGSKRLSGTAIQDVVVRIEDDEDLDVFELIARRDSLMQAVSERDRQIADLNQAVVEQEQSIQQLEEQMEKKAQTIEELSDRADEQERLVQALTEQLAEREQQLQTLRVQSAEYEQQVEALTAQHVERDQQLRSLTVHLDERERYLQDRLARLEEDDLEIQTLKGRLAEGDLRSQALRAQLSEIMISKSWRVAMMLRGIRLWLAPPASRRTHWMRLFIAPLRRARESLKVRGDLALIRSSDLFDEAWYLGNNPDVAEARANPLLHYLQFGGSEGRDPGPFFSSRWYLDTYEDVREGGVNPLVHYLRFGQAEGRSPRPGMTVEEPTTRQTAIRGPHGAIRQRMEVSVQDRPVIATPGSSNRVKEYLMSPVEEPFHGDGYPVTRIMHHIWRSRLDLQNVFDLYDPRSRLEFCKWFLMTGSVEHSLPADVYPDAVLKRLVAVGGNVAAAARAVKAKKASLVLPSDHEPEKMSTGRAREEDGSDPSGVNLVGYARGDFGLGEHVRMVARSFAAAGIPFSVMDYPEMGIHGSTNESVKHWISDRQDFVANIFHINADVFPSLYFRYGEHFFSRHFNIGYWAWELSKCPPEFDVALNMVDEVWAISEFVAESFRGRSPVPVVTMPLAVSVPRPERVMTKPDLGVPEKSFLFLFALDGASYLNRKNPIATIQAFKAAFPRDDDAARLLIKAMNVPGKDPLWEEILHEVRADRRISVVTKRLKRDELLGLYAASDAFVSLHRSEGFGRCLAEAMLLGKPVIATNYSGTREFAREGTACLVDYRLVPVAPDSYPFWRDQVWAEPDVDCAAELMQRLLADESYRTEIARAGQRFVFENFNEGVVGARYGERLDVLRTFKLPNVGLRGVPSREARSNSDDDLSGVIDLPSPSSTEPILASHIKVEGWVVSRAGIESVDVYCDTRMEGRAHYGFLRHDIGDAFPNISNSARSGFFFLLDVAGLPPGSHIVRVLATSQNGDVGEWSRTFILGEVNHLYERWLANNALDTRTGRSEGGVRAVSQGNPHMSVILRTEGQLEQAAVLRSLTSLADQDYRGFEVIIAGADASPRELDEITHNGRIHGLLRLVPSRMADWTEAVGICGGEFVCLLDMGDRLDPRALTAVHEAISTNAEVDLVYADEDLVVDEHRTSPVFKPAWSPLYLEGYNYVGRPWFARKELVASAVEGIQGSDGASVEHSFLKAIGRSARAVSHIPMVLVSRSVKPGYPHLSDAAYRRGNQDPTGGDRLWPRVSVVLATRLADVGITDRCFTGLIKDTDYPDLEVIVVANNLDNEAAGLSYLKGWPFKVAYWDSAFNWSAICNFGARQATGDYLLFLNDDVEPMHRTWLKAMVDLARVQSVGAVGAVLRYPNGTIQHAGITLVDQGGGSVHTFRLWSGKEPQVASRIEHNREQTGVTGACLLSRRDCFNVMEGFDEAFRLVCNDTDYCLRLWEKGYSVVVASEAVLIHHEGISRAGSPEAEDVSRFWARWKTRIEDGDPFSSPNLDPVRDVWMIDPDAMGTLKGRVRRNNTISLLAGRST